MRQNEQMQKEFEEYVVKINRTAKVVKGGRRFSFNALVVAGNKSGSVGFGFGKANEVPSAVDKAYKKAVKAMVRIPIKGTSIPHKIVGKSGASRVLLMPASPGTGIIACAAVRAVIEALGISDILTKSFGSNNPINIVRAVVEGLKQLRSRADIESLRGVNLMELDEKEAAYEKAVAEALRSGLSPGVLALINSSRKYAEGRAVRLEVHTAEDVRHVLMIAAAKMNL